MSESELKERIINLICEFIDLEDIKAVAYWDNLLRYFASF